MHSRKALAIVAVAMTLALVAGAAGAQQIYKWKDANGVVHFSQTPPASGTHYSKMRMDAGTEVTPNPAPASSVAAQANQNHDNAGQTAKAASGSQPNTPENRAKLCTQLSSNVELLQGSKPVIAAGDGGKQQVLDANARAQQLTTARAQQKQYCSSSGT